MVEQILSGCLRAAGDEPVTVVRGTIVVLRGWRSRHRDFSGTEASLEVELICTAVLDNVCPTATRGAILEGRRTVGMREAEVFEQALQEFPAGKRGGRV